MNGFDDDLLARSLAIASQEASESRTARRKAYLMTSIARLHDDPAEQARIQAIAIQAGIADDTGSSSLAPGRRTRARAPRSTLGRAGAQIQQWWRGIRRARQERGIIGSASGFLTWLGGGDKTLLAGVPHERPRFTQMALVLLSTAGIAALSMIFALHDGVGVPLLPSAVLCLAWGGIILNLDRFLVLSMGSSRHRWRLVLITLPRLALAAVLALVISTPLVLRIFATRVPRAFRTQDPIRS
jgi:hypothetical protein